MLPAGTLRAAGGAVSIGLSASVMGRACVERTFYAIIDTSH